MTGISSVRVYDGANKPIGADRLEMAADLLSGVLFAFPRDTNDHSPGERCPCLTTYYRDLGVIGNGNRLRNFFTEGLLRYDPLSRFVDGIVLPVPLRRPGVLLIAQSEAAMTFRSEISALTQLNYLAAKVQDTDWWQIPATIRTLNRRLEDRNLAPYIPLGDDFFAAENAEVVARASFPPRVELARRRNAYSAYVHAAFSDWCRKNLLPEGEAAALAITVSKSGSIQCLADNLSRLNGFARRAGLEEFELPERPPRRIPSSAIRNVLLQMDGTKILGQLEHFKLWSLSLAKLVADELKSRIEGHLGGDDVAELRLAPAPRAEIGALDLRFDGIRSAGGGTWQTLESNGTEPATNCRRSFVYDPRTVLEHAEIELRRYEQSSVRQRFVKLIGGL